MDKGHHHHEHHSPFKSMKTAFWLNFTFTIIEFVGGIFTNSFAIIIDAFHDLGDSIALGVGIFLEKLSKKKPTEQYTYGYKRFSLLSASILSLILIGGSVVMMIKSVEKFFTPHEVTSLGMIGLSFLGITVNGLAFWKMSQSKSEHHHNSRAMMLHFLEDVLGWVAVLVGGIIIYFTNWFWIDALLSFSIALFILYNAVPNLISVCKIFLQKAPKEISIEMLLADFKAIEGVQNIHNLRLWTQDGTCHVLTLHVLISAEMHDKTDTIRQKITEIAKQKNITEITIQTEIELCN